MSVTVLKVGGSLYDLPDLGPRLRRITERIEGVKLIVPGGGATANAIRDFDATHQLGQEASHWLALRACGLNAHFLAKLLGDWPVLGNVDGESNGIVDLFEFAREDERRADRCPHHWNVTSDSMAVRVAIVAGAKELIMLKSVDVEPDWTQASYRSQVDPYFTTALSHAPSLMVRAINFRANPTAS